MDRAIHTPKNRLTRRRKRAVAPTPMRPSRIRFTPNPFPRQGDPRALFKPILFKSIIRDGAGYGKDNALSGDNGLRPDGPLDWPYGADMGIYGDPIQGECGFRSILGGRRT